MNNIPKSIQPYFQRTNERIGNNVITSGQLSCCDANSFEVMYHGKITHGLFGNMSLEGINDCTILAARCVICGNIFTVFNSDTDGYDRCVDRHQAVVEKTMLPLKCTKCNSGIFSVEVSFEYPPEEDLMELDIQYSENAFTWIWVTLKCATCGKTFKNLIDCETA